MYALVMLQSKEYIATMKKNKYKQYETLKSIFEIYKIMSPTTN